MSRHCFFSFLILSGAMIISYQCLSYWVGNCDSRAEAYLADMAFMRAMVRDDVMRDKTSWRLDNMTKSVARESTGYFSIDMREQE